MESVLKIGEAAAKSGLSVKTIRYYDDSGLLAPTVERSQSGHRPRSPAASILSNSTKRPYTVGVQRDCYAVFLSNVNGINNA